MNAYSDKCILFAGTASETLGEKISRCHEKICLGRISHSSFPSGELYCQLQENVRGADVFLLNSVSNPANDNLMQLCIMADAARRASAGRITAVIPYMGYSRQDRKDKSRVPISAKLVLDILTASGINRFVTMDLHAPQIQGFTNLPFDHLQFRPALTEALSSGGVKVDAVVAPDVGAVKKAEEYSRRLGVDLCIISKKRRSATTVEAQEFIGNVKGKTVLIVDDLVESAGTLIEASTMCKKNGATACIPVVTHGCFTEIGINRLVDAFDTKLIDCIFCSNTVAASVWKLQGIFSPGSPTYRKTITVVDVAPVFAKAIYSIHTNESVSSLFVE